MEQNDIKIIITNPMFIKNGGKIMVIFDKDNIDNYPLTPAGVIGLTNKYNVNKVYIKGNKFFNKKFINDLKKEELLTYGENLIEVENI